uniref:Uncharacterized protein n=1 Tax=Kalanchoe fedtschenkoi TaxID=63787 RepID=A0A7N0TUZ0_KALFE
MSPNINSRLSLSGCTPPELIHMFARLAASHSSRTSPTKDDAVNDTISELNNCLNFKGKGNESPVRASEVINNSMPIGGAPDVVMGLDIVHQLLRDLISVILDLVSTPTCWGLITEVGLKLPFSTAYFPSNPSLLRILTGHLSSKGVKNIICEIHKHAHDGHILDPLLEQAEKNSARVNGESSWAMAMNFPEWFYYSCAMLFGGNKFEDNHMSDCTSRTLDTTQASNDKAPSYFAAKYIAWILSPVNQSHQLALCDFLLNLSESWVLKQVGMDGIHKDSSGCRKKLKMPKHVDEKDVQCSSVMSCLYKFQKLSGGTLQGTALDDHQKNLLYRRIPLGILIGNHNGLNDRECELIMHYANTGTVILRHETHNAQLNYKKHNAEHVKDFIFVFGRDEAITGANLAFRLTELVEKISSSIFETEEITVKFTYQVKVRIGKYLLKCIKTLVEHSFDNGCVTHIMDIRNRLIHWRQQGPELHVIGEDLDSVLSDLNCLMNCC